MDAARPASGDDADLGILGYKGGAASLIENFTAGHYFGVPLLQLYGMALDPKRAAATGVEPYPHMLRWLR